MFQELLKEITNHQTIIIHRHKNPDGDAIGSQIGLKQLLKDNFPEKAIYMVGDAAGRYSFMDDSTMDVIPDGTYTDALAIVLDTSAKKLISDDRYPLAARTARMDHHIFCETICDTEVTDTSFESCCGLIAAFAMECGLELTPLAAKALYTGMVTDSGRFRFRDVSSETMRLAGVMLESNINTDVLFAHLYLKEFSEFKFESYAHKKMKMTKNGVVSLFVSKAMQKKLGLSKEQASASVSFMDSIKGSLIWIAFIEGDNEIRVRLRSRFVPISELANQYRGGGHACAAGATVYSKKELKALLGEADLHLKNYKENNTNWL